MLTILTINLALAQKLLTTDLSYGNGFTLIQTGEVALIENYSKILHIFNTEKYSEYVKKLKFKIEPLKNEYLNHQITHIENQLYSIIPRHRQIRGLVNVLGTGLKWISGVMDDNDRIEIETKLNIITENNKNIIEQVNKQVTINEHFENQLTKLANLGNLQTLSIIQNKQLINETLTQIKKFELQYELDHIEKIIEQVRELLLASKLRTLNRDILTDQEINDFNITIDKLENIELDVALHDKNIIFVIRIPNMETETYKEIVIQPIPNKNKKQIVLDNKNYIVKQNTFYEKTNKKSDLKKIQDNCIQNIFNQNQMICNYEINTLTEVIEIGINVIVVINGNFDVNHTCNKFPLTLNGNYLIYIENCQIYLDKWYNKKNYQDTIIVPNPIRNITTNESITLEELHYKHIENIKIIKELKYHEKIQYVSITTVIIIIIIVLCIYTYIKIKGNKKTQVTVNLPIIPLENGQASSSGGVMDTQPIHTSKLPFA